MPRLVPPVLPEGTLKDRPQPRIDAGHKVSLRPWEASDAGVLAAAYEVPDIRRWHHRSMTEDEAAGYIREAADRWDADRGGEWAVLRDDEVVGRAGLRCSLEAGQGEVSYWTLPEARGRRTASRALDAVATWALSEIGFWRLEVRHSTANIASCRVAETGGFAYEASLPRAMLHADGWHDVHVHTRFRVPAQAAPAPLDRPGGPTSPLTDA